MAKQKHPVARAAGSITGALVAVFFEAWLAMLFVGIAHSADHRVPALGFDVVFWLGLAISGVVAGQVRRDNR